MIDAVTIISIALQYQGYTKNLPFKNDFVGSIMIQNIMQLVNIVTSAT